MKRSSKIDQTFDQTFDHDHKIDLQFIFKFIFKFIFILLVGILPFITIGCGKKAADEVVIYTSQDRVYASEIFADFTQKNGTKVLSLFDSESVKTAGLARRLISESKSARCDVFWSNEEMMLRRLAEKGVIDEKTMITFGYRTRRLVINTNLVSESEIPRQLHELTLPRWKGKVALAYPLYGTTLSHFMALRDRWGRDRWEKWCQGLLENEPLIVDGNSVVVRLVGRGQAWIGLTDSDDIAVGLKRGFPIRSAARSTEFPLISNSAAIVIGCPHPEKARAFIEYLQDRETQDLLLSKGALEAIDLLKGEGDLMDWERTMSEFDANYQWLSKVFFR